MNLLLIAALRQAGLPAQPVLLSTCAHGRVSQTYPLLDKFDYVVALVPDADGDFLIIPALVLGAQLPIQRAVGTSLTVIALNSLIGFAGDLGAGRAIDWAFLLGFLAFSLTGIGLCTYLTRFVPGARLKPTFG